MQRFLFISYYFPPFAGPASRHNLSTVIELKTRGFEPVVLTAPPDLDYPRDKYLERLVPETLEIRHFSWPGHNKYADGLRQLLRTPENPIVFKDWKRIEHAAYEALREKQYDFIYSVSGVGADHLAALELKRKTGLPWIAEFRDPWTHNVFTWNYMSEFSIPAWLSWQREKTKALLSDVLRVADIVVVESPVHAELLSKDYPLRSAKIFPYGMGYDKRYFRGLTPYKMEEMKKPVIGYVGSVYHGSKNDIASLVGAFKDLEDEGYEFTLMIVGKPVGESVSPFEEHALKTGLKQFTSIGRLDLSSSLFLMKSMDMGIVLTLNNYNSHINSKLWEYLNSGLTILAVAPEDGAMGRIVREGKCGYILPYERKGMAGILAKAMNDYKTGMRPKANKDYVESFSSEKMIDVLSDRIYKITGKNDSWR